MPYEGCKGGGYDKSSLIRPPYYQRQLANPASSEQFAPLPPLHDSLQFGFRSVRCVVVAMGWSERGCIRLCTPCLHPPHIPFRGVPRAGATRATSRPLLGVHFQASSAPLTSAGRGTRAANIRDKRNTNRAVSGRMKRILIRIILHSR